MHLQRLYKPAKLQGVKPSVQPEELRRILAGILQGYTSEARVRLIMSKSGEIYLALSPLKTLPQEVYRNGVKVITTDVHRESPRLKSTSFIANSESIRAQIAASEVFDALLLRNDSILEGVTSNFFYVKDDYLGTARNHILLGVTRRTVIKVGRGIGLDVIYHPLQRQQIQAVDEAFLTSSSRGIVPIIQINQVTIGKGIPGEITRQLIEVYNDYVVSHAEVI